MKKSLLSITLAATSVVALLSFVVMVSTNLLRVFVASDGISVIQTILSIVLPFMLAVPLYYFLRRHDYKRSEVIATLVLTFGTVIGFGVAQVILTPPSDPSISASAIIIGQLLGLPITFLISLVASAIAKKVYTHRHSMSIE